SLQFPLVAACLHGSGARFGGGAQVHHAPCTPPLRAHQGRSIGARPGGWSATGMRWLVGHALVVEGEVLSAASLQGVGCDLDEVVGRGGEEVEFLGEMVVAEGEVKAVLEAAAAEGDVAPFLEEGEVAAE